MLYKDVIQPILNQKCVSCHNDKKTKGGLKMNSYNAIIKGGKNGSVLMINNSMESKIHKRMTLPIEDRYHMPPKSRTQPSKEEIELIKQVTSISSRNDEMIERLIANALSKAVKKGLISLEERKEII